MLASAGRVFLVTVKEADLTVCVLALREEAGLAVIAFPVVSPVAVIAEGVKLTITVSSLAQSALVCRSALTL